MKRYSPRERQRERGKEDKQECINKLALFSPLSFSYFFVVTI